MQQKRLFTARCARVKQLLTMLFARKTVCIASIVLIAWSIAILFAPWIASHNPIKIDLVHRLLPLSEEHFFGTDALGRDIWSRVLYGGRMTFFSILLTTAIATPLGLFLGMLAGYMGGVVDVCISRTIDLFFAIPRLILALVFAAILGPGLLNAIFAVALTSWPAYARVARAESLALRNSPFIYAAQLQGASRWRILYRYLFPMCSSSMLIRLSMDLGSIILSIAGIGFLGLGAEPPMAEWGSMTAEGRTFLLNQWWVSVMPGLAIFSVSLCFNSIGDALRDVFDPKREVPCL